MKAQLHWIPGTDAYGLYVSASGPSRLRVLVAAVEDGRLTWVEHESGTQAEPTLEIPGEFIEPLREAFAGMSITDGSGLNFLRDAVTTRDRLLTLVERLAEPKP